MTEINVKGFRTDRVRPVRDCDGTLIEMTFEQTGTKIIWLKRDEENKTFAVTFIRRVSDPDLFLVTSCL